MRKIRIVSRKGWSNQGEISPLLFAVLMDEVTKDIGRVVKELLYAVNLVLLGDSWEEVESCYS